MKKLFAVLSIAILSTSVMACPKGTTLQGGTGPHHKGGKCVATKQVKKETPAPKTVNNKF